MEHVTSIDLRTISFLGVALADDIHRLEMEERESHSTDIDEKVKKYLHLYPY